MVTLALWFFAMAACAQSTPIPYTWLFSDEGSGLFCIPYGASSADKETAIQSCTDWIESGAGKDAVKLAIDEVCQATGSSYAMCYAVSEMHVEQAIAYIETFTPHQIVTTGDPLGGRTQMIPAGGGGFVPLSGAQFRGSTWAGLPGTATIHLDTMPAVPGYNIVYNTAGTPLTSFQGSDGNTYQVQAILYGEAPPSVPPTIPALGPWGATAIALTLLLVGVQAIARRQRK